MTRRHVIRITQNQAKNIRQRALWADAKERAMDVIGAAMLFALSISAAVVAGVSR